MTSISDRSSSCPDRLVEQVFRADRGRLLSLLVARTRRLDLAEDALAEAFARASERWSDELRLRLDEVDLLAGLDEVLRDNHRLAAVRAELARRDGDLVLARASYRRAVALCANDIERAHLLDQLATVK